MNILCIDLGNYSIKFLCGRTEGKDFKIKDFKKIDLTPHLDHPNLDELEDPEQYKAKIEERNHQRLTVQLDFIREYIQEENFEGKVLLTLPENLVTTRYIELPISNRKKAELMIPFQLDGNLPFSMNDTHWAPTLFKNENGFQAQVYITKIEEFDQFYSKLNFSNVEVATLAPPMSYWQSAIPELGMQGHAIIIDFGHEMINAYHLINQRIVTNHTSYYAGRAMDEFIAHSFSLDIEQVSELKLEKATFLPYQYDADDPNVSETEKSMDLLVKQFFYPIMKEVKRWIIGHQVKFNHPVEMIYITGGMSNIPGIKEFIEANFHVPVRGIEYRNLPFILPSKIYTMDFGLCLAMAQSQISKQPVANLLKGNYQSSFQVTIPLTSSSFVITRAAILALVLSLFMLVETLVIMSPRSNDLYQRSKKVVKNKYKELGIPKSNINRMKNSPEKVLKIVNRKLNAVKRDYDGLKDAATYNAMSGIAKIASLIGQNDKIEIIEMTNINKDITAVIRSEDKEEIKKLKDFLALAGLKDVSLKIDGNELRILTKE